MSISKKITFFKDNSGFTLVELVVVRHSVNLGLCMADFVNRLHLTSHLWTDAAAGDPARGGWVRVNAPLGAPAVFHREGSTVGQALREPDAAEP